MALTNSPGQASPPGPADAPGNVDPAGLAAVRRAGRELAALTDRDPAPGLLPAVMQTVWAELRSGRRIPLPGGGGTLFVTEIAVSNALVAHLDGIAELIIRRCTVQQQQPALRGPATVQVALTAALAYGAATEALLLRVRAVITATAQRLFGFTTAQVDIEIVDVYPRRTR